MPELPEVETTMRDLRSAGILGARIDGVEVLRARTVEPLGAEEFAARIAGCRLAALRRRGKFLLFFLEEDGVLAAHLRMSGSFSLAPRSEPRDRHDRLILVLAPPLQSEAGGPEESGTVELRFHDPRAFGRLRLLSAEEEVTDGLGPEPLDPALDDAAFHCLLQRRRQLKPLLMDQQVLAGLGNIYTDEALHAALLHPLTPAHTLDRARAARLLAAIRETLRSAIELRGTSLGGGEGNYRSAGRQGDNSSRLAVYGRTGLPCPRCGTAIERIIVGQRSTHLCPRCQPAQKD
jgi:formamidopyrimidine-DNA glycosylase